MKYPTTKKLYYWFVYGYEDAIAPLPFDPTHQFRDESKLTTDDKTAKMFYKMGFDQAIKDAMENRLTSSPE